MKACTVCGVPGPAARCELHRRGSASARGYGRAHRQATATAMTAEPWCHTAGGCPYPDTGTPTNPLTGGHPYTLADCGGDMTVWSAQVRVPQCQRCNSGKASLV